MSKTGKSSEFKGFIIKFENTGKETSVNCLCKTKTFAGTGIKSPFKRDSRLRGYSKIKGVPIRRGPTLGVRFTLELPLRESQL